MMRWRMHPVLLTQRPPSTWGSAAALLHHLYLMLLSRTKDTVSASCRLEANVVTPTTKAADHDEPIAPRDIVERGLMSQAEWDQVLRPEAQRHLTGPCAGA